jgi:hypothetical protein
VGESGAGGWVGNSNQVLATWTLDLTFGKAHLAFDGLIAVVAVELEFGSGRVIAPVRSLRKPPGKKDQEIW